MRGGGPFAWPGDAAGICPARACSSISCHASSSSSTSAGVSAGAESNRESRAKRATPCCVASCGSAGACRDNDDATASRWRTMIYAERRRSPMMEQHRQPVQKELCISYRERERASGEEMMMDEKSNKPRCCAGPPSVRDRSDSTKSRRTKRFHIGRYIQHIPHRTTTERSFMLSLGLRRRRRSTHAGLVLVLSGSPGLSANPTSLLSTLVPLDETSESYSKLVEVATQQPAAVLKHDLLITDALNDPRPGPLPADSWDTLDAYVDDLVQHRPMQPWPRAHWCLLLTMSVNPSVDLVAANQSWAKPSANGMGGQQHNPATRRALYVDSLRRWVENSAMPIIIAENSGERFDELRHMRRRHNQPVELIRLSHAATCTTTEIGCHEASAVLRAVNRSRLLSRRLRSGPFAGEEQCTHVLMVAGRYFIPGAERLLESRCGAFSAVAVQSPRWSLPLNHSDWRQETSAYGFDKRWAGALFN